VTSIVHRAAVGPRRVAAVSRPVRSPRREKPLPAATPVPVAVGTPAPLPPARAKMTDERAPRAPSRASLALVAADPAPAPTRAPTANPTPTPQATPAAAVVTPTPTPTPAPTPDPTATPTAAAIVEANFGGLFSQNYPPALAAPAELASIRSRLAAPVRIRIDVDEAGRATDVRFERPIADSALAEVIRSQLLALRYVPADCNGLHCEGSMLIAY